MDSLYKNLLNTCGRVGSGQDRQGGGDDDGDVMMIVIEQRKKKKKIADG